MGRSWKSIPKRNKKSETKQWLFRQNHNLRHHTTNTNNNNTEEAYGNFLMGLAIGKGQLPMIVS
jgi:hypothetical protein